MDDKDSLSAKDKAEVEQWLWKYDFNQLVNNFFNWRPELRSSRPECTKNFNSRVSLMSADCRKQVYEMLFYMTYQNAELFGLSVSTSGYRYNRYFNSLNGTSRAVCHGSYVCFFIKSLGGESEEQNDDGGHGNLRMKDKKVHEDTSFFPSKELKPCPRKRGQEEEGGFIIEILAIALMLTVLLATVINTVCCFKTMYSNDVEEEVCSLKADEIRYSKDVSMNHAPSYHPCSPQDGKLKE